ncbi:MAG: VWA domain-containing protein [Pyrinomonadaceae bacterium]
MSRLLLVVLLAFVRGGAFAQTPASPSAPPPRPALLTTAEQQDSEIEVVETNLSTILMTVTDKKGKLLTDLLPTDIRVYEDGVEQRVSVFERETQRPLSLALVFDVSASQRQTLPDQREAAGLFIRSVFRPESDRATVVSFAGAAFLQQPFTNDLARLDEAIAQVGAGSPAARLGQPRPPEPDATPPPFRIGGGTAIYDALFLTCYKVLTKAQPNSRRALILLSDGLDNESRLSPRDAVNGAAYANAVVYSIGIGGHIINKDALQYVSEETGGHAFFPEDAGDLRKAFARIERELRSQYLIAYTPTNKSHDGKRRAVRVEIVNPLLAKDKVRLAYRDYYYVAKSARAR